ncbi:MAG: RluA family pseudouridine synthase [Saprospiraceae bacterium]|nr:RluA family pseudouridine synthase [Pyrinomonadaceae bacterium]
MSDRFEIEITSTDHRRRLEDFLCDRFNGLSKMYLRDVIKTEKCEVNGRFENRGYLVRANDFVEIELDLLKQTAMRPREIPLDIVFEDEHLIVVNKPCGMLAHPSHREQSDTLLNALVFYLNAECGIRNAESGDNSESAFRTSHSAFIRPGLIHRLDKQTSGLMVVAKSARAHRIVSDHFHRKLVEKRYLALVEGTVESDSGTIEGPIGRYADLKMWDVNPEGKHAETRFWVKERYADTTLLELEPVTGRTNQLRIHCKHFGHPIVGDTQRGGREFERLCLHAWKIKFHHPSGQEMMEFASPVTFDLKP